MKKILLVVVAAMLFVVDGYGQKRDASVTIYEGDGFLNANRTIFDGTGQGYTTFPVQAADPALEVLILDNNRIEDIPNWIANLPNLRILSLRDNNLQEVNPVIQNCRNLEILQLSENPNLTDLPILSSLKKLMMVDVLETGINKVPISIRSQERLFYFKYSKPLKK